MMKQEKILNFNDYNIIQNSLVVANNKYYEGVFTQGNGYFHLRGSFEEGLLDAPQNRKYLRTMKSVTTEIQKEDLSKTGTYIPLIMGNHPLLGEVVINLPYFAEIVIYAGNEKLDMYKSSISQFNRKLNMKDGTLERSFIWTTTSNEKIFIEFKRFCSMERKRVFVQKVEIKVLSGSPKLVVKSGINGEITTNGYNHFENVKYDNNESLICHVDTDNKEWVDIICIDNISGEVKLEEKKCTDKECCNIYYFDPDEHLNIVYEKKTLLSCSRDSVNRFPLTIEEEKKQVKKLDYNRLLDESKKAWEKLWAKAAIEIDGREDLQNALKFSLYHLIRCTPSNDWIQICAKGFGGEAYYGRYFWDTEMYMLPFYIYTNPDAAKKLIMYRYNTLPGAKKNAEKYNCRGAKYPWHSGLTGVEQCSLWEYADNEVHITADVAFAVVHYYLATSDDDFMNSFGIEILIETAKYWRDRVDLLRDGEYHLINVMGPDEYSPMTRDNGFTNWMVKFNLKAALHYLSKIKENNLNLYSIIINKTQITDKDLDDWEKIEESLSIPYDQERDLYLQSSDFDEYAKINFDDFWDDKNKPFASFVSQEKIYRSKCIKQADILALMNIASHEFTDEQVKAAYDYYEPLTTHDSSLSPAIHLLSALRINEENDAEKFLLSTIGVDLDLDRAGAKDGIHIANCAALWQSVVFGFLGIEPSYLSKEFVYRPKLMCGIKKIRANIYWQGKKHILTASENDNNITEEKTND